MRVNDISESIFRELERKGFWDGYWKRYVEELELYTEIEQMLEDFRNKNIIVNYNIDDDELFDSSEYCTGYVSFAFITVEGRLGHQTFQWEMA